MNEKIGAQDALARLRRVLRPETAPDPSLLDELLSLEGPVIADAGRLLARVPLDRIVAAGRRMRPLRVAIAATFTAEGVAPLLRVELLRAGVAPEVRTFGFDQLAIQLTDADSALARFEPDVTLCQLHHRYFLPQGWDPSALPEVETAVTERAEMLQGAVAAFVERSPSIVLLHTVPLPSVEQRKVIGYNAKAELGRIWRELNCRLLQLAGTRRPVHTLDLEAMLVDLPAPARDERLFHYAGMAWSPAVELRYAEEAARFCRAAAGLSKKLLVLDLDNTLWGGVLGDDGLSGLQVAGTYPGNCYAELQLSAAALRRQGVLLAICSKNERSIVDEAFARHPELTLRSEDFVAQAVNWGRKDHSLRQIAESLNLGLDSVVFVDDSRFECDLVHQELPQVEVVHLAGDPAEHAATVLQQSHFDVLETTATDGQRTEMYRASADRQRFVQSFASAEDYLARLDLRVSVTPADELSLPRLVQLGLRTNQFNLAGRAETEARTRQMMARDDSRVLAFEVADRFGREGLVGGVWIGLDADRWVIENFVMSCRVFARGVEHAVLAHVIQQAVTDGARWLEARYRPTDRNRPVETFLASAGFEPREGGDDGTISFRLPLVPAPSLLPHWIVLNRKDCVTNG